ncbi:MAG: hypothetical protein AABZ30_04945 [Myxococcota bacterium]
MNFVDVEVEASANCDEECALRFVALGEPRAVAAVHWWRSATEALWCDVVGWGPDGETAALAQKVDDSGDGTVWLVRGGAWGVRLRPRDGAGAWSLHDRAQWGETYLKLARDQDVELA